MKIGILTVPYNNNYGGYLQSYALMTVLRSLGHEPTIIMRRHKRDEVTTKEQIAFFIKAVLRTVLRLKRYPFFLRREFVFFSTGREMHKFLNEHIQPQTKYIYNDAQLSKLRHRFDAIVVGSDQVWRAIYVPGIIRNYYLDFAKDWNVKKIAYAASFGTDTPEYTDIEKIDCGKLIPLFHAISLREPSGRQVFQNFKWKYEKLPVVLDPTMLLDSEHYKTLLPKRCSKSKGKIFCYVLDMTQDIQEAITKTATILGKEIYKIADIQKGNQILPSVEDWLSAIRDADYVITDSFHGTVFSVIFHKQFVSLVNKNRGAERFYDLLGNLSLRDNIIESKEAISFQKLTIPINWDEVSIKCNRLKSSSIKFLIDNL